MKKLLYLLSALVLPLFVNAQTQGTHSALAFRVTIPLFVEIVKDEHPTAVDGLALQALSLRTNSKTTCVILSVAGYPGVWQSTTSDSSWASIKTQGEHRHCTSRRGNLMLNLTHHFSIPAQTWPVQLTITSQL